MRQRSVRILGVRVDDLTTPETISIIEEYLTEGTPHQGVTVNPEFVMIAQRDETFRAVLEAADLALPDGQGLLWASRILGQRLRERVCGSDLVPCLAALAAKHSYRIFLLGAAPGVAERAAAVLERDNPGLLIVGTYAGSPALEEENEILERIRAAAPDILFVAYGAPQQDLWIHRNLDRLGIPFCMGVGGSLDFIAGVVKRAPLWMRRLGLEWLYRLIRQPWRWRRMLVLPKFALLVLAQRLRGKEESKICAQS